MATVNVSVTVELSWCRPVNVTEKVPATKPGDLPVAQLDRLHFVINLKTAKALGLTIPPSVLQRADQVMPGSIRARAPGPFPPIRPPA